MTFKTANSQAVFIDTSAIYALIDPSDSFHKYAYGFILANPGIALYALNATAQEAFTRINYDLNLDSALKTYDFLTGTTKLNYLIESLIKKTFNFEKEVMALSFEEEDEIKARALLEKYQDKTLSFHDALCVSAMHRNSIYRIFAFDAHFWYLECEIVPGYMR